ncbi:UTRA domain-containing protein [Streptomyces mutabilis]|uniref:UTRA domain-containing protein n=1 Tax=Streptomyces mutabilis TaxID=67332 RepID=UPI0036CE5A38
MSEHLPGPRTPQPTVAAPRPPSAGVHAAAPRPARTGGRARCRRPGAGEGGQRCPGSVPGRRDCESELCVRTAYEFLADGRPLQLSTSWEPYDLTAGTLVVLPERGPHAGADVVNRMAAIGITVSHAVEQPEPRQAPTEEASLLGIQKAALVTHIRRTYYSDDGRPVETADIVLPAAHCEIVYEVPINR